jgi:AraC-like DNA-binding protein
VLPPTLALWMPQAVPHEVQGIGGARLRRIALPLDADEGTPEPGAAPCRVTLAGPLLKALAQTLDGVVDDGAPGAARPHLALALALASEELRRAEPLPIGITLPRSPMLRAACEAALHDGAGDCDLQRLADAACTSARTLARRFQQEMAAPFSHWRMQLRLARLVQLWAEGRSLGESAAAVGYASPSALSYSVRRLLGMTPSCLLDQRQRGHALQAGPVGPPRLAHPANANDRTPAGRFPSPRSAHAPRRLPESDARCRAIRSPT